MVTERERDRPKPRNYVKVLARSPSLTQLHAHADSPPFPHGYRACDGVLIDDV